MGIRKGDWSDPEELEDQTLSFCTVINKGKGAGDETMQRYYE